MCVCVYSYVQRRVYYSLEKSILLFSYISATGVPLLTINKLSTAVESILGSARAQALGKCHSFSCTHTTQVGQWAGGPDDKAEGVGRLYNREM